MTRSILHIGAHKTATSYMQKTLALNIDLLDKEGVFYVPLDILRNTITENFRNRAALDQEMLEKIRQVKRTKTIIISDENIAGLPTDLVKHRTFYPEISTRLRDISDILKFQDSEIFFSIREYSTFLASMYCEYIRHSDFMTFEDYFELYRKSGFSWLNVIADIAETMPNSKITLWNFSDFRKKERDVFSALLGFDAAILAPLGKRARESFSDTTIAAVRALSGTLGFRDIRRVLPHISRAFPKGADYKAYNPIDKAIAAQLDARYEADFLLIKRNFPSVRFL